MALAILGIVLTTVFGVIGSGLRAAHRDEDRLLLGLVAQNLLARSRLDLTTADGPRSGDIGGGLRWRIESEPYVLPEDILPASRRTPMPTGVAAGRRRRRDARRASPAAADRTRQRLQARRASSQAAPESTFGSDRRIGSSRTPAAPGRDGRSPRAAGAEPGQDRRDGAAQGELRCGSSGSPSRKPDSASSSPGSPWSHVVNVPAGSDRRRRRDRRAGFTLVELLVSMVVLALVAVVMMSGLRFVLRAMSSTDNRREAMEELTLGLSVLRGELERAEPLMVKSGNRELVLFSGGPDRLRFANVEPPYLAGPPYLAYEYAVVPDDGGVYRIELRRAPLDPAAPDLAVVEAGEARTVLRVGQELRFSYFGKLGERDAAELARELADRAETAAGDPPRRRRGSRLARAGGARCASWHPGIAVWPMPRVPPAAATSRTAGNERGLEPSDGAEQALRAGGVERAVRPGEERDAAVGVELREGEQ